MDVGCRWNEEIPSEITQLNLTYSRLRHKFDEGLHETVDAQDQYGYESE